MARIRTVKPDLFRHEGLFELEADTGLPIRLTWCALPTVCDREGRFKWKPRELKLDILPYDDDVDFSRVLDALVSREFIKKYHHEGKEYGWIPTFKDHQVINNRESASVLPAPDESETLTCDSRVGDASMTPLNHTQGEGKGREGKGREEEGKGTDTPAKPDYSEEDFSCAEWMLSLIIENQPDFKKPNLQSWAKTIRLMRERDGRNYQDMARIWKWARDDDFWQANVLSADKFRKQYDRLAAQAMRPSTMSKEQKDAQREEEIKNGFLSDVPDDDYQGGIIIDHEEDKNEIF